MAEGAVRKGGRLTPGAYGEKDVPSLLRALAEKYNDRRRFECDPVIFPRHFAEEFAAGRCVLQDVEIAALFASHLAWGRREIILRDCRRLFDEMKWRPLGYVLGGLYRSDDTSLHRTIKWSGIAGVCRRLRDFYTGTGAAGGQPLPSLESLPPDTLRTSVFGQKSDPGAANKKIHLMRRWMVRNDGKVDLGLWKNIQPADLTIPLDTHVHHNAVSLGITARRSADFRTASEITGYLKTVFPGDPVLGDYALFAVTAENSRL